jgi:hypothetical protein
MQEFTVPSVLKYEPQNVFAVLWSRETERVPANGSIMSILKSTARSSLVLLTTLTYWSANRNAGDLADAIRDLKLSVGYDYNLIPGTPSPLFDKC